MSWVYLKAINNKSSGKKISIQITCVNVYLKSALVQRIHASVRFDKSPYYKKKFDALVKHRSKKRAIITIAQVLHTAIYQMLSTGKQ